MKTTISSILKFRNQILALTILFTVLTLDLLCPLGVAVGVLYLFCFFLICRENKKVIILFAAITSILVTIKLIVFVTPDTNWFVYANRGMTILVIFIIAILAIRHRALADRRNYERNTYIRELEDMLFMTSHEVRQPIAHCLGLMDVIDVSNPSKDDLMKIYDHIKHSAGQLDTFTKKLTSFIVQIHEKNKMNRQ